MNICLLLIVVYSDPNIINTSVSEVPSEHKQHNLINLTMGAILCSTE